MINKLNELVKNNDILNFRTDIKDNIILSKIDYISGLTRIFKDNYGNSYNVNYFTIYFIDDTFIHILNDYSYFTSSIQIISDVLKKLNLLGVNQYHINTHFKIHCSDNFNCKKRDLKNMINKF